MPCERLTQLFNLLENNRNPNGSNILRQIVHPTNQTRTLLVRFDSDPPRQDIRNAMRITSNSRSSRSNALSGMLHQLGFELSCNGGWDGFSEYRLSDHEGYNVDAISYRRIILNSFMEDESNHINRFKERLWARNKYDAIKNALRVAAPSLAPPLLNNPPQQPMMAQLPQLAPNQPQIGGASSAFQPFRRTTFHPYQRPQMASNAQQPQAAPNQSQPVVVPHQLLPLLRLHRQDQEDQ